MTEALHTAQPLAVGLHAGLDVPVSIAALYVELAPLPHSWNARRYHQIMLRALRGQKKPRLP